MSSKQTTTQNNAPYAPAQPGIDLGLASAQNLFERGGFNVTPYQGNLVAPTDAFSNAAYGMAPALVQGNLGGLDAARGGILRALDPSMRSGAWDTVQQNVIDRIMPSINSSFAGSGMTGSSLHAQNLARGLSSGLADVENQFYQQGENRALQAAGMLPSLNAGTLSQLDYLRGIGSERQGQAQAEIQADVLRDQQAKTAEIDALTEYLALVSGAGSMFGVQSQTSRSSPGLLGIAGLGLQAAPLIFPSDRRLKRDISPVGVRGGLPWYSYRYKTDKASDGPRFGFMSDDVRKVMPDAVTVVNGFDMVDYGMVLGVSDVRA